MLFPPIIFLSFPSPFIVERNAWFSILWTKILSFFWKPSPRKKSFCGQNTVFHSWLQPFWKKRNLSKKAAVQFKNDALKMRFDWGKLRNIIKFKKRASQPIWETLKQLFSRKINFFLEFFKMGKKMMSRHCLDII